MYKMNTTELPLPEKIFPVEYAGFFDFNEEGIYNTSVINRDDYPNADLIANEISKRYNNFDKMKEALKSMLVSLNTCGSGIPWNCDTNIETAYQKCKSVLESLK